MESAAAAIQLLATTTTTSPSSCFPRPSRLVRFALPPMVPVTTVSINTCSSSNSNASAFPSQIGIGSRRKKDMSLVVSSITKPENGTVEEDKVGLPGGDRMLVFVPPHPLIKHWISVLRNQETPPAIFKSAMGELGRLLIYEASRDWLTTISAEIQSPMGTALVEFINPMEPIMVIPILRAGLALVEHVSTILPATKTYHLGLCRNEETLLPSIYLNNLPDKFPTGTRVLVVDPMLATGGTIVAAIDLLKDRGVENRQIKVLSAVAAPPALRKLSEKFPGLHVYTGIIDPEVNEKGYIIPGLGDAGDRSFGT